MYEIIFFNADEGNRNLMNAIPRRLNRSLRAKVNFDFISHLIDLENLKIENGCCVVEPYMNSGTLFCLDKIIECRKRGLKVIIYSTQIMEGVLPNLKYGVHYDVLVENSDELLGVLEKLIE